MNSLLKKSGIKVRRMDFSFKDVERYWFNGDVLTTHLLNAMSATFPEGERFFVESVRAFRDQITDPVLQKEVSAFIGQEAMHAKEHNTFNRYLEGLGLDIAAIENNALRNINRTRATMAPEVKLAITCALEHFTAIMAEQMLGHPELMETIEPQMLKLWAWHAIEETEHKGVAFDVFRSQVGDEEMRRRVMRRVTFFFIMRNSYFTGRLLYEDGKLFSPSVWYKGITTLWGRRGLFRGIAASYMEYYDRDFHPWQRDTRMLLEQWKKKLGLDEAAPETAKPVAVPELVTEAESPIVVDAKPKAVRKPRAKAAAKPAAAKKPAARKPKAVAEDAAVAKPKRTPRGKAEPEPQLH